MWNPGEGSDTVDGNAGNDTLQFNGANVAENMTLSANRSDALLTRDVGNVTRDLKSIETVDINAKGGADTITVDDLAKTAVRNVNIHLGVAGVPDGAVDTVVINATDANDVINVVNNNGVITVTASPPMSRSRSSTPTIKLSSLARRRRHHRFGPVRMLLTENGGDGADVLVGAPATTPCSVERADDILNGNGGQDVLDGGPGNNVLLTAAVGAPGGSNLGLLAQLTSSNFAPSGAGQSAMPVGDPAASQSPQLATPH